MNVKEDDPDDGFDPLLEYLPLRSVTRAGNLPDATTTWCLKHKPERLPIFIRMGRKKLVRRDRAREWLREQREAKA